MDTNEHLPDTYTQFRERIEQTANGYYVRACCPSPTREQVSQIIAPLSTLHSTSTDQSKSQIKSNEDNHYDN